MDNLNGYTMLWREKLLRCPVMLLCLKSVQSSGTVESRMWVGFIVMVRDLIIVITVRFLVVWCTAGATKQSRLAKACDIGKAGTHRQTENLVKDGGWVFPVDLDIDA
jgi:hypothetical protein